MANKLTRNPWIIDTGVAFTAGAGLLRQPATSAQVTPGQSVPGPVEIVAIIFSGYTTGNTDAAVLYDIDGRTFLTINGTSDKSAVGVTFPRPFWIDNIGVASITSGIVTIFLSTAR